MGFILIIAVVFILISFVIQYIKNRRLYRQAALFSGPTSFPIIGSAHLFIGSAEGNLILQKFICKFINFIILKILVQFIYLFIYFKYKRGSKKE